MIIEKEQARYTDSINFLLEALNSNDKKTAHLLAHNALRVINASSSGLHKNNAIDAETILHLINTIKPKDTIESILAIQYIILHVKAMIIMSENNNNTLSQGITMLRLSHQVLSTLQQYRGKSQTINVNYNVHSQGDTVLNTMIKGDLQKKEE